MRRPTAIPVAHVAEAAADGDESAWEELFARFDALLRGVVRGYRLSPSDVDDVVQTVWLRALLHLDRIRDPAAVAGWLVITARREALRALQRPVRELLTDEPRARDDADEQTPETLLLDGERRSAVRTAVQQLDGRQRMLLRAIVREPDSSYEQLSTKLDMPLGAVGPTRLRALERLRRNPSLASVAE
jgi:RNA polymerase sigma factor (sigma-70 family)